MKLQPNIGNLNLHHRWLKFGLDEFLCINFQIFAGNCEKSNLAISWDALVSSEMNSCLLDKLVYINHSSENEVSTLEENPTERQGVGTDTIYQFCPSFGLTVVLGYGSSYGL